MHKLQYRKNRNWQSSSFFFFCTCILSTSSLGYKALCIIMNFLVLLANCLSYSLFHLRKKWPEYLTRGTARYLSIWGDFYVVWFWVLFSFSRGILFSFFLPSLRIWWCPLPVFSSICKLPFLQVFRFFLIWWIYSYRHLSFSAFSYWHGIFFYAISLYRHCISSLPVLGFPILFFFCFILSMYIRWRWLFATDGLVSRLFAKDPGELCSIPGRVIPKTLNMVLDTSLLNTQQY